MITNLALALALSSAGISQETPAEKELRTGLPPAVTASRLPVLTDQLRTSKIEEAELRALLETALGSGVSVYSLVGALEVVVEQLEAGVSMPDLALHLPGLIVQGFEGDALAARLLAAGQTATAAIAVGASPAPVVEPEAVESPSAEISSD